ncbi:hypothetical protein AHAS_Ahas09G0208900 [Arachis hypogaea]
MAALWRNGVVGFGLAAIRRPSRRAYHGGAKGAAIAVAPWRSPLKMAKMAVTVRRHPSPPPVAVRCRPSPLVVTAAHHHNSLFFLLGSSCQLLDQPVILMPLPLPLSLPLPLPLPLLAMLLELLLVLQLLSVPLGLIQGENMLLL